MAHRTNEQLAETLLTIGRRKRNGAGCKLYKWCNKSREHKTFGLRRLKELAKQTDSFFYVTYSGGSIYID